ncbi:hypothetical protein [Micromonospora sp. NPDC047134]|uniref:hypothetical protein n=1 Tax=Micromonospora sp. NPDC047134 TaxID=3154340 RepID=UPI0033E9EE2B
MEAYRITAALLVKLGERSLAWLAADRAMSAATGDRILVACAAVQLGQALPASTRARPVMLAAAYQAAPPDLDAGTPQELSLCGALLLQAATMAARSGDERATAELLDEAADMAGDTRQAVTRHQKIIGYDGWRCLPVERRAAHLIEVARAYLHAEAPGAAARVLL